MSFDSDRLGASGDASSPSNAWDRDQRNGPDRSPRSGALIVIETLAVTGVLVALATFGWHVLAPEVFAEATEAGFRVSTAESRRLFGIEVSFAVVTAAAGIVAGAWLMLRHRLEAVRVQLLLVASGLVGAVAVWLLGRGTGPGDPAVLAAGVEPGTTLEVPLDVESYAMFSIWPIAAVVAGAVVVAIRDRPAESGES